MVRNWPFFLLSETLRRPLCPLETSVTPMYCSYYLPGGGGLLYETDGDARRKF